MRQIRERGAHDAADVDAMMAIEVVIFVRDECVPDDRRNPRDRNPNAVLLVDRRELRAVASEDAGRASGLVVGHAADVGEIASVRSHHAGDGAGREQHEHQQRYEQTAPETTHPATPAGFTSHALRHSRPR